MGFLARIPLQVQHQRPVACRAAENGSNGYVRYSRGNFFRYLKGNPPSFAAFVTGSYAMVAGGALTLAPKTTLGLLFRDAAVLPAGWIQVGGILFTLIGMQYLGCAVHQYLGAGRDAFYHASVWSRLYLAAAFAALVALKRSEAMLLVLSALNIVGALSMWRALGQRS